MENRIFEVVERHGDGLLVNPSKTNLTLNFTEFFSGNLIYCGRMFLVLSYLIITRNVHAYIYIHTHTHTHIHIYIYICVCVYIYVCVCVYIYIYICVYIYIYMYTHTVSVMLTAVLNKKLTSE